MVLRHLSLSIGSGFVLFCRSGGSDEQKHGVQFDFQVRSSGPLVLSYWLTPGRIR